MPRTPTTPRACWSRWGWHRVRGVWHLHAADGTLLAEIERDIGTKRGAHGRTVQDPDRWIYAVRLPEADGTLVDVDLPTRLWRRKVPLRDVQRHVEATVANARPAPVWPGEAADVVAQAAK